MNRSEEVAFRELHRIADDNDMRVFAKTRLSDVLVKGATRLSQREFDFYTRSHCDFVVTDNEYRPKMIVEYDGPLHGDPKQQERDAIKNALCLDAGLGLLRIHDRHVTKLYRGMTVLRWIVEVSELEHAFDEAQQQGLVPDDEPFDPSMLASVGDRRDFPYWLSAPATHAIHGFFKTLDQSVQRGWSSFVGHDSDHTSCRLSCIYFGEKVLWARTAMRKQDLSFPHYDLLNELDTCELGIRLAMFQKSEISAVNKEEFQIIFEDYIKRWNAHPSHSMGSFPISGSWTYDGSWRFSQN